MAERDTDNSHLRREQAMEIANEFTSVHVCKVHTRQGVRLEIDARRRGRLIRLDPLELEALACQDDESFLGTDLGIGPPTRDDQSTTTDEEKP
jgi:hypothetical protein